MSLAKFISSIHFLIGFKMHIWYAHTILQLKWNNCRSKLFYVSKLYEIISYMEPVLPEEVTQTKLTVFFTG